MLTTLHLKCRRNHRWRCTHKQFLSLYWWWTETERKIVGKIMNIKTSLVLRPIWFNIFNNCYWKKASHCFFYFFLIYSFFLFLWNSNSLSNIANTKISPIFSLLFWPCLWIFFNHTEYNNLAETNFPNKNWTGRYLFILTSFLANKSTGSKLMNRYITLS